MGGSPEDRQKNNGDGGTFILMKQEFELAGIDENLEVL